MSTLKLKSKTIVFVHGLFVNPKSWSDWAAYFEKQGYTTYTPANPFHEGEPSDRWQNIHPQLGTTNFEDVVKNIERLIATLPEKPILIGHSLGGLVVQKLIALGKGEAGILIDGAPPMGIIPTQWSFWKSNFRVVNYLKGDSPFLPDKQWFRYTFGNTLPPAVSDQVFDELVVPESRNIARGTLKSYAKIDFKKPHAPLLFIAGEKDNIIPAALNKKNFDAYKAPNSIRTFKMFEGKSHFIVGEPGWEAVAGYVLGWLRS